MQDGSSRKQSGNGNGNGKKNGKKNNLCRMELDHLRTENEEEDLGSWMDMAKRVRPRTRQECVNQDRPCLFVGCKHHLYLDVNQDTGSIKFNFPSKEVWEMKETCALDVADRGGITLEEVGEILNLTRERIRQVEVKGLNKLRHQTRKNNLKDFIL